MRCPITRRQASSMAGAVARPHRPTTRARCPRPRHHPPRAASAPSRARSSTPTRDGRHPGDLAALLMNQPGGFDCPGCAWPEPAADHRSPMPSSARTAPRPSRRRRPPAPASTPSSSDAHGSPISAARAVGPLARGPGAAHASRCSLPAGRAHYRAHLVGRRLRPDRPRARALGSPDEAIFYTSGRTSNEAAFLYQLFVRHVRHEQPARLLEHVPRVERRRRWATRSASARGRSRSTTSSRPTRSSSSARTPARTTRGCCRRCEARGAARLPRSSASTRCTRRALTRFAHPQDAARPARPAAPRSRELFLPVRINGDVALLKGIMKEVLDEEKRRRGQVLDRAFIAEHTSGFDEFAAALDAVAWDEIVERERHRRAT